MFYCFRHSLPVNFLSLHLGCFPLLSSTQQMPGHPSKPSFNVKSYGELHVPPTHILRFPLRIQIELKGIFRHV